MPKTLKPELRKPWGKFFEGKRKEVKRKDGSYVRFDDNAGVVIDKQGLPRGTRILGPIAREVKEAGYNKISSLAREVV